MKKFLRQSQPFPAAHVAITVVSRASHLLSANGKRQVEVRRWLMDCVASVHCADGPLREAMSRLVPPELGQKHLSPDGSGQLIALHLSAVALFVEVSE